MEQRGHTMSALAVVIPIGPNCKPENVRDTIASVDFYAPDRTLILVDDSGKKTGDAMLEFTDARVIEVKSMGLAGGLYASLAQGFEASLNSDWDVLLRLDTDALVADGRFLTESKAYFSDHPRIGSLGSYTTSYQGQLRSRVQPRKHLLWEASGGVARNPALTKHLIPLVTKAKRNGYKLGESVLGGVALYSREAVVALHQAGALSDRVLPQSRLQEDHLYAIWLAALGFGLADFGTGNDNGPMGVKHLGLPAHPDELIEKRKALIHSTKYFADLDETGVRSLFRSNRLSQGATA
jgi:hypothetical protein